MDANLANLVSEPRAVFHRVWCTVFAHVVALLCAEKELSRSGHTSTSSQLIVSNISPLSVPDRGENNYTIKLLHQASTFPLWVWGVVAWCEVGRGGVVAMVVGCGRGLQRRTRDGDGKRDAASRARRRQPMVRRATHPTHSFPTSQPAHPPTHPTCRDTHVG